MRSAMLIFYTLGVLSGACSGGKQAVGDMATGEDSAELGDVTTHDGGIPADAEASPDVPDGPEVGDVNPGDGSSDSLPDGDGGDATDDAVDTVPEVIPCEVGKPCDDGDPCTLDDQCNDQGKCLGTPKLCDDGEPCNGEETCGPGGECVPGGMLPCDDDNPCTDDGCSPEAGCTHTDNDALCDDGDACTLGDQCIDGGCQGQEPVVCDDGDPCTDDSCDPVAGCKIEAAQDGTPCDDGEACTVGDKCVEGVCVLGSEICECYADLDCDYLDDEDLCNGSIVCDMGKVPYFCKLDPGSIVECPGSGTPCMVNQCDSVTGSCKLASALDNTPCDDGDPCTPESICTQGKCVGELLPACGIGDPCTGAGDCQVGQICLYDLPGGYCTKGDCQGSGCPFGATCLLVEAGPLTACFLDCQADDDCRIDEGYQCTPSGVCACGKSLCEAGQPACNGSVATTCNACGSGYVEGGINCAADGKKCVDGQCQACDPAPCDECESLCPADQTSTGPVCGNDGVTYDSFCQLKCAIGSVECTALTNCHQMAYPFACSDFCVVEEAEPIVVGDTVPPFQCKDLNTSSVTFQAPVSDVTLKQLVWIAYFGSCT